MLELSALWGIQNACDWQVYRQGINRFLGDSELVMQVWACCPTGRAYIANQLTLFHAVALAQTGCKTALVSVQGSELTMMLQNDRIAVTVLAANKLDRAICGSVDRGA